MKGKSGGMEFEIYAWEDIDGVITGIVRSYLLDGYRLLSRKEFLYDYQLTKDGRTVIKIRISRGTHEGAVPEKKYRNVPELPFRDVRTDACTCTVTAVEITEHDDAGGERPFSGRKILSKKFFEITGRKEEDRFLFTDRRDAADAILAVRAERKQEKIWNYLFYRMPESTWPKVMKIAQKYKGLWIAKTKRKFEIYRRRKEEGAAEWFIFFKNTGFCLVKKQKSRDMENFNA